MSTPLENLEIQVTKLAIRPGDTLHVQFSRHLHNEELDNFKHGLYRLIPPGVCVIVLGPDAHLTHTPAPEAPDAH